MITNKRAALLTTAAVSIALVVAPHEASAAPLNPGDAKNCSDFPSWGQAQVWYETYAPVYGDVAHLDADGDGVPCQTLTNAPEPVTARTQVGAGYAMLEANGTVFGFGDIRPVRPIPAAAPKSVSISAGPGGGYWILSATGVVAARGETAYGNVADKVVLPAGESPTTIAGLPDGSGYYVFTDRGRAVPFGSAVSYGDMIGVPLNGAIVASAVTATGKGYWMVGSDGGIFSFGDAKFYGSMGGTKLNQPVVGIAPDPDGVGYWLVAADGGIFAFNAPFKGSTGGITLNQPVIGAIAYGDGYLMVASDGGIFSFSSKPFLGSLGSTTPPNPITGVAVRSSSPECSVARFQRDLSRQIYIGPFCADDWAYGQLRDLTNADLDFVTIDVFHFVSGRWTYVGNYFVYDHCSEALLSSGMPRSNALRLVPDSPCVPQP